MTLFSYKVFATIVEHMSFRKTAEVLNLTPSAVSHCVGSMEEELGFPLFIRQRNKISLTSDANILLPYVRQVLQSDDILNSVVEEIKGLQRGTVRVGCFNTVCIRWMPQIIRSFHEAYPGLQIELYQGSYDDITKWLENGDIDLGFLSRSSAGNIRIEPLYQDELMAVVPKGFSALQKDYITVAELNDMPYVQPMENGDADSLKLLEENNIKAPSACHVNDDFSALKMIEAGCGVCILPKLLVDAYDVNVDVYPIRPNAYRVIGVAFYEPSRNIPAVQKLYRLIIRLFADKTED